MTTQEIIARVRGSALLVSLSLGSYNPVKVDKSESRKVAADNGITKAKVAKVTKNLLPGATALDRITKLDTCIRATVERFTAPYARGIGLLPAAKFFDLRNAVNPLFDQRDELVRKVADDYALCLDQAQRDLGGLFRPEDYPDARAVVSRFYAKLETMPIGNPSETKLNVIGEIATAVQAAMEETLHDKLETVTPYVRELLLKPLTHMSAVLQNPEAKLYESTFLNVLEAAEQAEHLNLMDDDSVRNAVFEINEYLRVGRDIVKDSVLARGRALADCNRIIESLGGSVPAPAIVRKRGEVSQEVAQDADVSQEVPAPTPDEPEEPNSILNSEPQQSPEALLAKLGW